MALFGSSEKKPEVKTEFMFDTDSTCLLYTSDAADE